MRVHLCGFLVLCFALAGCQTPEEVLEGERLTVEGEKVEQDGQQAANIENVPFAAPAQQSNTQWTHHYGTAGHVYGHPALAQNLQNQWVVNVGISNDLRHKITTSPVLKDGRIFTMDSQSMVTAVALDGTILWQRDLTSLGDLQQDVSGGGLAVDDTQLYVTTGFDELHALNVTDGTIIWTQALGSFGGSAPSVFDGLVYVATRDGTSWALNTENGKIEWQLSGPKHLAGYVGGPGPAVNDKWAIFPFGTGEVISVFRKGGLRNWTSVVSGHRLGFAISTVEDLTADPVIVQDNVIVGTASGRVVNFDLNDGEKIWSAQIGAQGPVTVSGNSVFLISDVNKLVRLSRETGEQIWSIDLPHFVSDDPKRREGIYAHYGPIIAGGRLIVGSSDNLIREYDPQNGQLLNTISLQSGVASAPIVVGETLYFIGADASLYAFR